MGRRILAGACRSERTGCPLNASIPLFQKPFYFVRHGETEMNAAHRVAGSIDSPLTARGREQALDAAAALAGQPITAIYTSPLQRARDTAIPIARVLGLAVTSILEIAERNWGVLEGQPRSTRMPGTTPEGAETPDAFMQRVLSGFAQIDSEAPLIVGHSGVYRVLCRTLAIADNVAPVGNALPLRCAPLAAGGWTLLPLTRDSET